MHKESDSNIKIVVIAFTALLVVIGGIVAIIIITGKPPAAASQPASVSQPASAQAVAAQLSCVKFADHGPSIIGGVIDSGVCWIGSEKYAINTFASKEIRNQWLKAAEPLGVNPKWETDTAVIYPSVALRERPHPRSSRH
jgi:hypothetical protein